jgi:mono/diheme cytochrome c family protein
MMKSLAYKSTILLLAVCAVSCFSTDERNYQYFPNMYESEAYEAYQEYPVFPNSQEAMQPVEGTVPRGWMPYPYENTEEGYQAAKANLENPLPYTEDNVNEGKALYTIYCAICHGDKGDGKGTLAEREKILGIPAYNAPGRDITPGSAYHVMYFGRNTMGSYAVQTTAEERWKIAMHVMDLKRALNGQPKREFEQDSIADEPIMMYSEMDLKEIDVYQKTDTELDFTIHEQDVSENVDHEQAVESTQKEE